MAVQKRTQTITIVLSLEEGQEPYGPHIESIQSLVAFFEDLDPKYRVLQIDDEVK